MAGKAPSKRTIEEAFHGASTKRTYSTYQKQFEQFLMSRFGEFLPSQITVNDSTDFFHHLYDQGKKSSTVDLAKAALVAYFNANKVTPNPAQDVVAKRYITGLQKYNKVNNLEEEKKAHPLTIHELSTLINSFANMHPFVASMLRLLLSACYLGCLSQ
ncbi:hypothetical protein AeRB84_013866 [Aphanomyces euteiches]|nr:hypothetical protein AeRB84_013866 [Aphanomyces euteiches]